VVVRNQKSTSRSHLLDLSARIGEGIGKDKPKDRDRSERKPSETYPADSDRRSVWERIPKNKNGPTPSTEE